MIIKKRDTEKEGYPSKDLANGLTDMVLLQEASHRVREGFKHFWTV